MAIGPDITTFLNQPQKSGAVKPPVRNRGGFLSSLISEGSGVASAAAVTPLALAAAPATFGLSLLAIPAAGFVGSGAGRVLENQVRDDRGLFDRSSTTGKSSLAEALEEGGLSALFSGVPVAGKFAAGVGGKLASKAAPLAAGKLGTAISNAPNISNSLQNVAKSGAGKLVAETGDNLLQRAGSGLRAIQRGIVPGNNGLSTQNARAYNAALDSANKWFHGIGKSAQFTNAEEAVSALSKAYKAAPEAAKTFGKKNADELSRLFLQNIDDNPALRGVLKGKNAKVVQNLLDDAAKFGGKKSGDFVEYMSTKINPRYRTISSGGSAGSVESQILEAFRDAGKNIIDEGLKTRSGVNKQLSALMGATKELGKTITRDTGANAGQGLTLGRMASNVVGSVADVTGRALQQVGNAATSPVVQQALVQGAGKLANAMVSPPPGRGQLLGGTTGNMLTNDLVQSGQSPTEQYAPQSTYGLGAPIQKPVEEAYDPYPLANAISDIQRDPRNAQKYMDYYDFVQKARTPATTKLTAQEKRVAQQAQSAYQGLQQLKGLYKNAGGGQNRFGGSIANVQGLLGWNSDADAYNKIRQGLTTRLARALGETGVLTDQDREVYLKMLPRLEDTEDEAAIKIQILEDSLAETLASLEDGSQGYTESTGLGGGF